MAILHDVIVVFCFDTNTQYSGVWSDETQNTHDIW